MGEKNDAGTDFQQPVVRLSTEDCSVCGGNPIAVPAELDKQQQTTTPVVIPPYILLIGTLGGVSAVHYFMWLCFQKPDAANIIIPLVFLPVVQYLATRYAQRKTNDKLQK